MTRLGMVAVVVTAVGLSAGLAGCGGTPATRPSAPRATDYSTASADPSDGLSGSPSPGASVSPGASPGTESATPGGVGTALPGESPAVTGSPGLPGTTGAPGAPGVPGSETSGTPGATASGGVQPVSCTEITPVRVLDSSVQPRRTTEVVSVVSDGNSVQSGTRSETAFADPTLTSPLDTQLSDPRSVQQVASLLGGPGKLKVLLTRPDAPDSDLDPDKRPFNQPGTYVLYNASGVVTATVLVQCGGQEQRWTFSAEAAPLSGQVNCAVDPPRSNALARTVYSSNC